MNEAIPQQPDCLPLVRENTAAPPIKHVYCISKPMWESSSVASITLSRLGLKPLSHRPKTSLNPWKITTEWQWERLTDLHQTTWQATRVSVRPPDCLMVGKSDPRRHANLHDDVECHVTLRHFIVPVAPFIIKQSSVCIPDWIQQHVAALTKKIADSQVSSPTRKNRGYHLRGYAAVQQGLDLAGFGQWEIITNLERLWRDFK